MWYRKQNTYHSLASNPEYADSESDDEKQLLPTERSRAYGAVNSSRNRWLLFTSAFLNVVLFGAFISGHLHLPSFHASPRWKGPWAGTAPEVWSEPYTHPLREAPEFGSLKQVVFEEDPKFMGDSPDVDAEWDKLWPLGKGFVKAHGRDDDKEDYYVVSAFHQFHCIDVIRVFYNLVAVGTTMTNFKHIHVLHCLEYLRQTVVCHADPTLEFTMDVDKDEDPRRGLHRYVDGQYVTHQCRDYQALVAWAEEHRYNNSSRILHDVDIE